jgi:serine/threonine-protein kinase
MAQAAPRRRGGELMSDHHRRVRALFLAACDLPASEREAFLERECHSEGELSEVKSLLAADSAQSDMFSEANLGMAHRLLHSHASEQHGVPELEAFLPGVKIAGRYRIVSLIGHGGMGEVYRADDLKLGSPVALKFLQPRFSEDARALEYFLNEVRLSRRIAHPNVCRMYDIAEADGRHFICMEYVDGEDLQSLLRRIGRLPRDRAIEVGRQICLGLSAAHDKGVLHRDLKPSNVMIDGRGQVRITDFGLAVPTAEPTEEGGALAGTPAYMAPELLAGAPASVASDVYSLGLVLYELFTGQRVHSSESATESGRVDAGARPRLPSDFVANIDPDVERIILQCLEHDPQQRPPSARAVAAGLGGRPLLEAALLAGTTPSPDLVASAEDRNEITRSAKVAVLTSVLVGIVLIGLLSIRSQDLLDFHAETLIRPQGAAQLVRSLGYDGAPVDSTWGLAWNNLYFEYFREDAEARREWARLTGAPPTAATLWYRESVADYLVSLWGHGPFAAMFVTPEDPPPLAPGMISLVMSGDGRLLEFIAAPIDPPGADPIPQAGRDWLARLFDAAGIDGDTIESDFVATTDGDDLQPPPIYVDTRRAWKSRSGRILIDAGAYRGLPVFFRLTVDVSQETPRAGPFGLVLGLTVLAVASMALIIGRRNWLAGRADRRGTARIFEFIVVTSLVYWLCQAHHVPGGGEVVMLLKTTARAVLRAVVICGAYLALEPYVRNWRPDTLITWNRLIRGQVRDPVVGQSILVGVVAGVVIQLIASAGLIFGAHRQIGFVARPVFGIGSGPFDLRPLMGPISAVGQVSAEGFLALVSFIACPMLFFALRSILRSDWAAVVAFVLFYSGSTFLSGDIHGALTIAMIAATGLFLLFRFGVLTVAAAWFSWRLLSWPVSLELTAPHLGIGLLGYLTVAGLALYSFRVSLGRESGGFAGTATG